MSEEEKLEKKEPEMQKPAEPETKEDEELEVEEPEDDEQTEHAKIDDRLKVDLQSWNPKTSVGKKVKAGEITSIDFLLDNGYNILESEIVDALMPELEKDLLLVGQAKGKFGGGKRRVFRQTQKKTPEGNKPRFATFAIVGNRDGYVGIGHGKARETVPAREKALRNAKLNIIKIRRGCGSWECGCKTEHSIPFAVSGKVGSVEVTLMPAPKGAGLVAEKEIQRILEFAGVKDVYSRCRGQTRTKINLIFATMQAIRKLMSTKMQKHYYEELGVVEGSSGEKNE